MLHQPEQDLSAYEADQRKRTLSIILIITSIAAASFGAINLWFYESNNPAIVFFAVSILCLPTLWLNMRNRYRLSGLITASLVFIMAHYNLVDGAGIRDPGVVAYPLIILIGGLLFGKRAIPIFTFIGLISLIIVVAQETTFNEDIDRLIIISVLLLAGATATWAVIENLENNINRIKESEENLRQALEQSRKHAQRVNGIIETVPEGVLLFDNAYQVRLANQTAENFLTVLSPGYQQGQPLTQLGNYPIDELVQKADDRWQEIAFGEPEQIFEAAVRPVQKAPLPPQNWVLVLRDVTQEHKRQESMQEQERLATVGHLASGIAHDFRNILSVISIYGQIVQRGVELPKQKDYLSVIQDQVEDASVLIEQILDFGRQTIMQRKAEDVVVLVESVVKLLQRTLPSNIAIEFTHQPGRYILHADRSRLQQALMNLAVNARDAMPDGGVLKFALAGAALPDELPVKLEKTAVPWLVLQVSDTGEGIRPENLKHIFEPFFTTKAADKGTGLGLAQVYGIVKQHEGEITVSSERNKGTTFSLFFPTTPELPPSSADKAGFGMTMAAEITVLLVEDNPLIRASTEEMLRLIGCRVITAGNGHEALKLYTAGPESVDLVISDIVMPGMGGVELYHQLQKAAPQVKFLVVTGYPLNKQARDLLEKGYIDWIQKPFQGEQLAEKIWSLVEPSSKTV